MRKTIEVGKVLKLANHMLAAPGTSSEQREGVCSMLETILLETGNYQGYRYLDTSEIAGNGTRRFYFASKTVQKDYDAKFERLL